MIFKCLILLFVVEALCMAFALWLRKRNQWFITKSKDLFPQLDEEGLNRFFEKGQDKELGWVRKPNTKGNERGKNDSVAWIVNEFGARSNHELDHLESNVSVYGDSFSFARQVEDKEAWTYLLSKELNTNVLNFGVGNYGFDQSLLRLEREIKKYPAKVVIIGVVPDTISRILSSWKHYYEYGNTFAFKPRYILEGDSLKLISNPIQTREEFDNFMSHIDRVQKHDFFFKEKFKKELVSFPFSFHVLKNPRRSFRMFIETLGKGVLAAPPAIIMSLNLKWRIRLFKNQNALSLLFKEAELLKELGEKENFTPFFFFMPQKDDVTYIKESQNHFYQDAVREMNNILPTYDFAEKLIKDPMLDDLFCDKTAYGGHMSPKGNELFFKYVLEKLKSNHIEF